LLWLSPSIKIRTERATWQIHIPAIRLVFLFAIDRHTENGGSGEMAIFGKFFLNASFLLLHHAGGMQHNLLQSFQLRLPNSNIGYAFPQNYQS
jgi:hypothetical protein